MNEVDTARVRAMFRTYGDLERDAFSVLERQAALAVSRLEELCGEMVRAAVDALEAGRRGDPGGFVAPGVAGARSLLEVARGFAGEARDSVDMREMFRLLDSSEDQYDARDGFEECSSGRNVAALASVCARFGELVRSRSGAAARGFDYVDDVLRGSSDFDTALDWAVRRVHSAPVLDWVVMLDVVSELLVTARGALDSVDAGADRWAIEAVES